MPAGSDGSLRFAAKFTKRGTRRFKSCPGNYARLRRATPAYARQCLVSDRIVADDSISLGADDIRPTHVPVSRDISRRNRFATGSAPHLETELGSARVAESHDVLWIVAHELVAPIADRVQNSEELLTRLSKVILISSGPLLIELALHDPRGLQRLQPRSEDVARGACIERDVVEAMLAEDDLAKGEQRPFFADHFQGGINGTDSGVGNAWGSHRTSNIGSLVDLQFKPIDVALAT
jgi:hypothetical protein